MIQVKIVGAGSIGNHLAHACRRKNWAVTLCDIDAKALERTRTEIYPSRYGSWDDEITLSDPAGVAEKKFDLVIVGTPPDHHVPISLRELDTNPPSIILIEKPLCPPDMAGCGELQKRARETGARVLVGYNHRMTRHTEIARDWLAEGKLGKITTLRARFREHWGGIFGAHPWLSGPADTYLGFTERGGGAIGEHSHAVNIWQYFARLAGAGCVSEVSAMLDEVEENGAAYDRIAQLSVRTETGLVGTIVQDVITRPAQKWVRLEADNGYLEWEVNATPSHDRVKLVIHGGEEREEMVEKTRPDDFRGEIDHVGHLLENRDAPSPLDMEHGLETMRIVAAAIRSSREGQRVTLNPASTTPN